jgi:Domain of unknown function (DUF3471)
VQVEQPDILMEKLGPFVDLQERKTVSVPLEILHTYTGQYNAGHEVVSIDFESGHLTMQVPGQAVFPLFAESQTKFFLKVAEIEIEFVKDAAGKISRATLYQDGETIKSPRM